MRRRIAASLLLVAGSSMLLTGCDGELVDAIESAAPSADITLPALPTGDGGGDQEQTQPPAQTPEVEQPQPTQPPAQPEATPTTPATDETDAAADTTFPPWAWALIVLVLVLLVGLLVSLARRRRSGDDASVAAQADGQIAWARANVDDPLVRWRADQLALPLAERDSDSELARRWALVDQRVTAATSDLLTLESGSKDEALRQAAVMLRQAAEGYRTSVDGLAQSIATGEQARIAQASQALSADTTLLDQARQRFRTAAKL